MGPMRPVSPAPTVSLMTTSRALALRLGFGAAALLGAFFLGRGTAPRAAPTTSPGNIARAADRVARSRETTDDATRASSDLASLVARVQLAPRSLADEDERQRLIEHWAAKDPRAAIEFARTQLRGDRRAQAMAAILARWGTDDPAAAWQWVAVHAPEARHHFDTLLEAMGKNAPALAARYAADFAQQHPGTAVEMHLAALLGLTHVGDFATARAIVDGNGALTAEERGVLHNFIAGQWARFAPADAAAWVQSLPAGPGRDQAIVGLGESWSDVDPSGAADFAAKLPAGELRQVALRQAILKWSLADSAKANEWVATNKPHEDFDQAIAAMVTFPEYIERHLDLALNWADTIYGVELRQEAITQIIGNWHAHDPAAALEYLRSRAKLPAAAREALLKQLQPGD